MLTVRMNDLAARALGLTGVDAAVPLVKLTPELRELVSEGVVRRGEVLLFAGYSGWAGEPRGTSPDLTRWECSVSAAG